MNRIREIKKKWTEPQRPVQYTNIHKMGILKRRKKETERFFEQVMAKSSPNLMKNNNLHIQEAQQTPSKTNSRDPPQMYHNQTVEGQRQWENIESGEKAEIHHR